MRASFPKLAVIVVAAGLLATESAVAAEALQLGGTGSAIGMLRQVGADFSAATGVKIDVIPSLGTTGAIRALKDGVLDIAVAARPLTADEAAAGLHQVDVVRTLYVMATSLQKPNGLKSADLPAIFTADKPTWADGTPIRIILRPRSETDTALLGELFNGLDAAIESARRRSEVPTAATDQDNVALAERTPGSLIGTTVSQLTTEHSKLHIVPLDGVDPTLANFESGAYRYAKKLYFILSSKEPPVAQQFLAFLHSPAGTKALREAGTLPGGE